MLTERYNIRQKCSWKKFATYF